MSEQNDLTQTTSSSGSSSGAKTDLTRRKITKAALASPVVASLSTTPAFGCSVSGFLSGNTSDHSYTCGGNGCTPGFWKNNMAAWPKAGYNPGSCKKHDQHGKCKEWDPSTSDPISKMFMGMPCSFDVTMFGETGNDGTTYTNSTPILSILLKTIKGGGNTNSMLAHYIAAIFNASANPSIYGSSVQDIQKGLCKAYPDKMEEYKNILAALNERGCFLDAHGDCKDEFVDPLDSDICIPACDAGKYYDEDTKTCVDTPL